MNHEETTSPRQKLSGKAEIIIAGFGGQGVLSMGKILAYAAMTAGHHVTWMPSYGPEQRGGTANCTVIISPQPIASPILSRYDIVVALNQPSLDRFLPSVKPGGILLFDPYGIAEAPVRPDIRIYSIDAMNAAAHIGAAKCFNMVVLGGLLKALGIDNTDAVVKALHKTLPPHRQNLIPLNEKALLCGMELAQPV